MLRELTEKRRKGLEKAYVILIILGTLAFTQHGPRIANMLFNCADLAKYMPEGVKRAEVFSVENYGQPHLLNYTFDFEKKEWNKTSEPVRLYPDNGPSDSDFYWTFFSENFDRIALIYSRGGKSFYFWRDAPEQSFEMPGFNQIDKTVYMIRDELYYWRSNLTTAVHPMEHWFLRSRGKPGEFDIISELRGWTSQDDLTDSTLYIRDVDIMYYIPYTGICRQAFQIFSRGMYDQQCNPSIGIFARTKPGVIYPLRMFGWHGRNCDPMFQKYRYDERAYVRFEVQPPTPGEFDIISELRGWTSQDDLTDSTLYIRDVDIMYYIPYTGICRQAFQIFSRGMYDQQCNPSIGIFARTKPGVIYPLRMFGWHGRNCDPMFQKYRYDERAYVRFEVQPPTPQSAKLYLDNNDEHDHYDHHNYHYHGIVFLRIFHLLCDTVQKKKVSVTK
uniref:Uncharacterized protein n=1 Tax=Bursaphelenchus xylophilus TaxID=6326 RepID=A0A1I7S6S2_BURXY